MSLVRLAVTILALAPLLWSVPARGATVAIVRPTNPSPLMVETLGRIRGELTSVGFATEFVDEPAAEEANQPHDLRPWLEQLVTRRGFAAVVAIVGAASPDAVEVWVVDKVTGKSVVRTVHLGPGDERTPEILSVRAIELLRSSFLEIELAGSERLDGISDAPPAAVVKLLERERPKTHPERFGVELGGLAITSLDGVDPALLPVMRFDWTLHASLVAQVTLAGLGTRPTVANQEGSAQISQGCGLLGASYTFSNSEVVRPFLVLSAGALHTAVDGRTQSPANQGRQVDGWSFLVDGGAGARVRPRDRLFLSLGFHGQVAQPRPAIRFLGEVVATSAGPNLSFDFTVGAWL